MKKIIEKSKSKNNFYSIISTTIKSLLILITLGFIILYLSSWGASIYSKNSLIDGDIGSWGNHYYLDSFYGLIGIIIFLLLNCFGFLSYNLIVRKFKNCKVSISKFLFIIFCILINYIMIIFYWDLFDTFSFKNSYLEIFNMFIVRYGFITFPLISIIIYIFKKRQIKNS